MAVISNAKVVLTPSGRILRLVRWRRSLATPRLPINSCIRSAAAYQFRSWGSEGSPSSDLVLMGRFYFEIFRNGEILHLTSTLPQRAEHGPVQDPCPSWIERRLAGYSQGPKREKATSLDKQGQTSSLDFDEG